MGKSTLKDSNKAFKNTGRTMAMVAVLSIAAKALAMLRQMILTSAYGATIVSDAYVLAQTIPNTLFNLVGMAVGVSFTPLFQKVLANDGELKANEFTSNVINLILCLSGLFVIVVVAFARQIILLFAGGGSDELINLTVSFLRMSVFSLYFVGMNNVLQSYLKSRGSFFGVSIIGIPLSIVEILSIIIAVNTDDRVLAGGIVAATFAQWCVLFASAAKIRYKHKLYLDVRHSNIAHMFVMSLPILLGICIDEVNVIVDRRIASGFDSGSISLLSYATTLVSIVHTIITVSINTVIYPKLAADVAAKNDCLIMETLTSSINKSMMLTIPSIVGILIFANPILQLLYMRGKFSYEEVSACAVLMQLYALSLFPNALRSLTQSYFYSHGKTKLCMYATMFGVIINILLNVFLSRIIGVNGLALATSISIAVTATILFLIIQKENSILKNRTFVIKNLKYLFSAIVMGALGITFRYVCNSMGIDPRISLIPGVILCIIAYFTVALLVNAISLSEIKSIVKRG